MTSDLLIEQFDRISDAPDAIHHLKRFILDLAVRGKLVEQNPHDESASDLLKRIATETMGEGAISSSKHSSQPRADELLFDLKPGWQPVKFNQILVDLQTGPFGSSLHQSDYEKNGIPVINPASIKNGCLVPVPGMAVGSQTIARLATFKLRENDIVMARRGEMGRCAIVSRKEEGWLCGTGSLILRLAKCLFIPFVALLIGSPLVRKYLSGSAVGATMQNLNQGILLNLVIALPPLAEQHRIVAKVDELMSLCDQLEARQTAREARRTAFVAAANRSLNNDEDQEASQRHASFYLKHFSRVTLRRDHIEEARNTILTLAMRGMLVKQDSSDEPASELLDRVRLDKTRLEGAGGRIKSYPALDNSTVPYQLPKGWRWARLGELCTLVTSGSRDWAQFYSAEGAIFVRMGNLSRNSYKLRLGSIQRVTAPSDTEGSRTRLEEGDILISITGDVGMLGLIPSGFGEAYINQHTCLVRRVNLLANNNYLPDFLRSPFAQVQFRGPQRGIKNSFRLTDVTQMLIPLPPLAEQQRIAARVSELMTLCDEVENQIATSETQSSRLLESLLH